MSGSVVLNVPVGAPQLFRPGPVPFSVRAVPAATGTVLIEVSQDNGTTFVQQPIGAVATVNSVGSPSLPGQITGVPATSTQSTVVRVSAFTAAGTAILSDLSLPQGGAFSSIGGQIGVIEMCSVPYTTQVTLTTELELYAIRFPVGSLRPNFRLEVDLNFVCSNNVNVKTIKAYFGNSANTALEGGTICATQVLTSSSGGRMALAITGRNDGATVDASSIGSALGYGISATAPVAITTLAAYAGPSAVEQALVISYQKATAADVLTLQNSRAILMQ
jgi:hypothetical protein